ncbi:Heterokaryon incompatibility protein 6, OR allele [Fusarium oxysporum f. sp. albedinis]|nr:Heterokaryon incompatibility protein 6, OR allele [Fusarium oxysporum f. sp. albedinis]
MAYTPFWTTSIDTRIEVYYTPMNQQLFFSRWQREGGAIFYLWDQSNNIQYMNRGYINPPGNTHTLFYGLLEAFATVTTGAQPIKALASNGTLPYTMFYTRNK